MILVTGYWPPTNIKQPTGLLGAVFSSSSSIQNWSSLGYDVVAVATEYPSGSIGTAWGMPFWGTGTGGLIVDYRQTSQAFWTLVQQHKPVAIMSFSRDLDHNEWIFETGASNRPQIGLPSGLPNGWVVELDYVGLNSSSSTASWSPPYVGGVSGDPAASSGLPNHLRPPQKRNPPDATESASHFRSANLPWQSMSSAIASAYTSSQINPHLGGDTGDFVSGFMAYHVSWYQQWTSSSGVSVSPRCRVAGHTHIGGKLLQNIPAAQGAFEIQLKELIKYLDANP